ncbi:MAG: SDR family oxidoreductase [Pseudomonadales bacterium]|nr:SDR family oxidoreductase [Pseudomonadales bacterium]
MAQLANKNVIVIGGTSGIGLAAAQQAQAAGAQVFAVSRTAEKVTAARENNPGITFDTLDTHDVDGLQALFQRVGKVDHIIAAATGSTRTLKPFMEQTEDQFMAAFNKFWGYCRVARQGVPNLTKNGSITLISGVPARKCGPGMAAVSCVGSAVEGLVRALAAELAPIRVNAVAPGIIDTAMFDRFGENKTAMLDNMGKNIPLGRVGRADEVASAILLTLTNDYMTGTTLDVDGGQLVS